MSVSIKNEQEMVLFAQNIAKTMQAGDCLAFSGELGAGKSFLARAIMRALGVEDEALPSPTFAIIQEYQAAAPLRIAHMDWYRLEDEHDVAGLGVHEFFSPPWISLIEWSSRAPALLPKHTKYINITMDAANHHQRYVSISEDTHV